jgi:hypothetical protein
MIDEKMTIGDIASAFVKMIKEEAKNDAIKSAHVQDNLITATVFNTQTIDGQVEMILKYSINGKVFISKGYHNPSSTETKFFIKQGVFITQKVFDDFVKDMEISVLSVLSGNDLTR